MTKENEQQAKLVIVPTPIGNLGDMTVRSMRALESADTIYSEDTRMTQKLISALDLDVDARIFRLDENTMPVHAQDVADLVASGKTVAYCSDAGMPGVSDPGLKLVSLLRERGIPVEVLPGASASIVAYVSSSTENPHFYFGAFLPRKESQRKGALEALASLDAALVFYESPNRLAKTLQTIAEVFPYRKVAVCRELTKLHEEVAIGDAAEIADQFLKREEESAIKGECAIVIDGPTEAEAAHGDMISGAVAADEAARMLADGASSKSVVQALVDKFGITKNRAYEIFLEKKSEIDG